jgi:hypothetical protein
MNALAYATHFLASLPALLAVGAEVASLIDQVNGKLSQFAAEKRDPNPEEWEALNTSIAAKRQQLHS